jgi:2-oxoglutarate ferredoxin oxidoreductase subunit beta
MSNLQDVAKQKVAGRPQLRTPLSADFCPGCHYGIIIRVLCEVIDELGIVGRTIGVSGASCAAAYGLFIDGMDFISGLHGRASAIGTGIKRAHPDAIVLTVQGDGDIAAIGLGDFMNALVRGEKHTTIMLNNACFGMTGGQMAPTTLTGMRTTTTPEGRSHEMGGFPIHMAELAASMQSVAYSARCTVHTPANFQRAKRAVRLAFDKQIRGIGFGFVEFLSACPSGWGLSPLPSMQFLEQQMLAEYPLGEFKNVDSIM